MGELNFTPAGAVPVDGAKIAAGYYTGNGKYGASNPNKLTFPFVPKILIVAVSFGQNAVSNYSGGQTNSSPFWVMIPSVLTTSPTIYGGIGGYYPSGSPSNGIIPYGYKSADGKTLFWYGYTTQSFSGDSIASSQFNATGQTYHYVAIG